ncbi:hypothetical protein GBA52_015195 [Prunus armeniaca]|nr:hypothetical protein GBA52_015195 [Prunus armeniaca]
MGRDWFKVKLSSEEDIDYVLENRPWFVQGHIFALKRWTLDFSPFHASIESVVGWARIPFLPLHYRDVEVLQDLAFILGTPFRIDEASLIGNP